MWKSRQKHLLPFPSIENSPRVSSHSSLSCVASVRSEVRIFIHDLLLPTRQGCSCKKRHREHPKNRYLQPTISLRSLQRSIRSPIAANASLLRSFSNPSTHSPAYTAPTSSLSIAAAMRAAPSGKPWMAALSLEIGNPSHKALGLPALPTKKTSGLRVQHPPPRPSKRPLQIDAFSPYAAPNNPLRC